MPNQPRPIPIALQVYSLREDAGSDFRATLKSIREIGYDAVEFAGYYGMSSSDLRSLLDDLGLKAVGSHVGYEQLRDDLDRVVDYNLEIGAKYLICPAYRAQDRAGWVEFADFLCSTADKCESAGLVVGYHNHSHELARIGDDYILDIIFDAVKDAKVISEMDLGWVLHAGVDPLQYLRQYSGRCPLVHVKDFDADNAQTEVGTGVLDLEGVVRTCHEAGVEWMIVETEMYKMKPIDSVRVGYENLRKAARKIEE